MKRIREIKLLKKYFLVVISVLIIIAPLTFTSQRSLMQSPQNLFLYLLGVSNFLIIIWLFYSFSEINLYKQGKIGRSLTLIFIGLMIYTARSMIVSLGDMQLQSFLGPAAFFVDPLVKSLVRTLTLSFLALGIFDLVKLYKS